jgi:uncharacterized membrane protein
MSVHHHVSWRNPRILTTLVLVFLCGATAGALTMRYGMHAKAAARGLDLRDNNKEAFLSKFRKELNLTPQQETQISGVLDDYLTYYRDLLMQMDSMRADGKARILRVLDDHQRQKFEKMLNDLRASR